MRNIEVKLFLLVAFFLGTWGALFNAVQTVLIGLGLVYNIVKYKDDFLKNLRIYKYYVAIPIVAILYAGIHSLIIVNGGDYADFKPGYGIFEKLLLFFLLGVLYVISVKSFMTTELLKKFLIYFTISVFTFNLVMIFHLTGVQLFVHPGDTITYLYESRFGFTKYFLGGQVYLDAEAMQIYAAALIAYFFGISQSKQRDKIIAFTCFIILVWFLSLTVTKSSILSFLCGFILFNFYFLRKLSLPFRRTLILTFVLVGVLGYFFRPASFDQRWEQTKQEINDVRNGNTEAGGSITPRYVFYRSCFENIDSWGIWGLGVYTNPVSKQWYIHSGNHVVAALSHSHNSYLQYWMLLGVVGFLFILSWFVLPVIQMIRLKQYSFLALALILAFFIDNNFEVMLIVSDGLPVVIFFLAMFYVHQNKFYKLENISPDSQA